MRVNRSTTADASHVERSAISPRELVLLGVVVVVAAAVRLPDIGAWYWGDEIQTVVISDRSLLDIPGALELDGAPPAFYVLLSLWMSVFGSSETSTHLLTVLLSLLTVVAAWWFARRHGGRVAGLLAACAVAVNPYLVLYSTETRNYALFALVGVVAVGLALEMLHGTSRRAHLTLGVVFALALLTHAWGTFFIASLAGVLLLAAAVMRDRDLAQRTVVAGVVGAVLFAPWVPTFLSQRRHTAAPWNTRYSLASTLDQTVAYLGNRPVAAVVAVAVVVAVVAAARARRLVLAPILIALACVGTLALGFLASYIEPIWQARYGIVVVGVLLLASSTVAARTTVGVAAFSIGIVAMAAYTVVDVVGRPEDGKPEADLRTVAEAIVATEPEFALSDKGTLTALRYHLGDEVGESVVFVSPLGVLEDPTIYDWRDETDKLRVADPAAVVDDVVSNAAPGDTFVVLSRTNPPVPDPSRESEWTIHFYGTARELADTALADERLREVERAEIESWTLVTLQRR